MQMQGVVSHKNPQPLQGEQEMKKLMPLALCAAILSFTPAIQAENPGGGNKMRLRSAEKNEDGKGLTEEQRKKIKDIMESGRAEAESLRKQMKEIHEKMQAVREQKLKEVKAILTPEQYERFKNMQEKRRQNMDKPDGKGKDGFKGKGEGKGEGKGNKPAKGDFIPGGDDF
jgi:Spy/CpxP family protein refolding chaperone